MVVTAVVVGVVGVADLLVLVVISGTGKLLLVDDDVDVNDEDGMTGRLVIVAAAASWL